MKKVLKNIKQPITSLIGLAIMLFTTYSVLITHKIPWIWDGIAGIIVGSLFFLVPDKIVTIILSNFTKFLGNSKEEDQPPQVS